MYKLATSASVQMSKIGSEQLTRNFDGCVSFRLARHSLHYAQHSLPDGRQAVRLTTAAPSGSGTEADPELKGLTPAKSMVVNCPGVAHDSICAAQPYPCPQSNAESAFHDSSIRI